MTTPFRLAFRDGLEAKAVRVHRVAELPDALRALGFRLARPVLVLVGGAGGLRAADLTRLGGLVVESLLHMLDEMGAALVDGGTDAGVMQLVGQCRARLNAGFPLIGVAAAGAVILPDDAKLRRRVALERHHTHFVLVPGSRWGDESPWIARVASALAGRSPSLTLLVNGGAIALEDVAQSVKARRPVIVVGGSGRAADGLAATLRRTTGKNRYRPRRRMQELAATGLLRAVDPADDPRRTVRLIRSMLAPEA